MDKIKVIQYGLGAMGRGMLSMAQQKEALEVVAGIDQFNIEGYSKQFGIKVYDDPEYVFKNIKADVVLHATTSLLEEAFKQIVPALEAGMNVITIAEEAAFPQKGHEKIIQEIDSIAKKNNVKFLGTGINPGFVMDLFPSIMSSVTVRTDKIKQERIVDYGKYGQTVWEHIGVGLDLEEFNQGVKSGKFVLHVGLEQTVRLVAEALGWEIDKFTEEKEAIVSRIQRDTQFGSILPGKVGGFKQIGKGYINGEVVIEQVLVGLINPDQKEDGYSLGTSVSIEGDPTVHSFIGGGVAADGGKGTYAHVVNTIPQLVNWHKPGFVKVIELPLSSCLKDKK